MSQQREQQADAPESCLNCASRLTGQYCGKCGQRARSRLISIWELLSDAFGDLFELDSRVWRTLLPLFSKPGHLTAEYLRGRRVHFLPPFRTYLVLSLLFFVLAFFDPQQQFGLLFDSPVVSSSDADSAVGIDCSDIDSEFTDESEWLARHLTPEKIKQVCERITADGGRSIAGFIVDSLPTALYVLLPLAALFLKMLYPLSRRYYVEHLLFVVHFHAFVFLALILQMPLSRFAELLPTVGTVLVSLLIPLYIPVYLYKAMRRVYGQRHLLTTPKFVILTAAYFTSFGMMLAVTTIFAVLSL